MKKTILGITAIAMLLLMVLATSTNAATVQTGVKGEIEKGEIVKVTIKTEEPVESMEFKLTYDNDKFEYVDNSMKTDLASPAIRVNKEEGTILVSAFDASKTADTLSLEFKAIKTGTAKAFTVSEEDFSNNETMTVKATATTTIIEKKEDDNNKPGEDDNNKPGEDDNNKPGEDDNNKPGEDDNNKPGEDDNNKPGTDDNNKPGEDDNNKPGEDNNNKPGTDDNNKPGEDDNNKPSTDNNKPSGEGDGKYYDEDGKEITKIAQTGAYVPVIIYVAIVLGIIAIASYKISKRK